MICPMRIAAVMIAVCMSCCAGLAQVQFTNPVQFATGKNPAVAVTPNGLVLEFHESTNVGGHYFKYTLGNLQDQSVTWGETQNYNPQGQSPAITIAKDGLLILSFSGTDQNNCYYQVGKLDINGGINQVITWLTNVVKWGQCSGQRASTIGLNDRNEIVGIYSDSSRTLYYRTGNMRYKTIGNYEIIWEFAAKPYDSGRYPNLTFTTFGQLIAMHTTPTESLQHFRAGTFNRDYTVSWGPSPRFGDKNLYGGSPTMNNDLGVIGIYLKSAGGGLYTIGGRYVKGDSPYVDWTSSAKQIAGDVYSAAIANDGRVAIEVHQVNSKYAIYYAVAPMPSGKAHAAQDSPSTQDSAVSTDGQ